MNDEELFVEVWQALVEHGSSRKNEEAVRRFWKTLSQMQKQAAANNIPRKVRDGKFVQYNPIQAIKENIRAYRMTEPENLNGTRMYDTQIKTTLVVSALYDGKYGVYTLNDALSHNMTIKYGMNFDWETYVREKAKNPDYHPVIKIKDEYG